MIEMYILVFHYNQVSAQRELLSHYYFISVFEG